MAHRARLGGLVIDCKADDVTDAAAFWGAALGGKADLDEDGRYAEIAGQGDLKLLVQAVDHDPRVHLDIEADDIPAEVARLEALGATLLARIQTWTVMQAPTGHRFCVVRPQGSAFDAGAREVG